MTHAAHSEVEGKSDIICFVSCNEHNVSSVVEMQALYINPK